MSTPLQNRVEDLAAWFDRRADALMEPDSERGPRTATRAAVLRESAAAA